MDHTTMVEKVLEIIGETLGKEEEIATVVVEDNILSLVHIMITTNKPIDLEDQVVGEITNLIINQNSKMIIGIKIYINSRDYKDPM